MNRRRRLHALAVHEGMPPIYLPRDKPVAFAICPGCLLRRVLGNLQLAQLTLLSWLIRGPLFLVPRCFVGGRHIFEPCPKVLIGLPPVLDRTVGAHTIVAHFGPAPNLHDHDGALLHAVSAIEGGLAVDRHAAITCGYR